jgi:restriction endonuclease S subunit
MPQNYKCGICDSKPDQLSHHKSHIGTQKHQDKREVFELKLEKMTSENLQEKYGTSNIQEIVERYETQKVITISKNSSPEIKKRKTNTLIYENSAEVISNSNNSESFKYKFLDFLGKMHNLLRGAGVTGDQALDDILNCLFLCYIEDKISEEGDFDLANSTKSCYNGTVQRKVKDYVKYLKVSYLLEKTEELRVTDGLNSISKCAKLLSKHPITKKMFKKDEDFINCPDTVILSKLLKNCQDFSKNENIFENVDITGIAYEYMTTKHAGNGGTSKEMGQYFTERPLMEMCFRLIDGTDITDLKIDYKSTMGDEFCATFGFPLMARKFIKDQFNIDIQDKNMYGVEYHERLSKFAYMNAMFSMKNFKNIERGNSFITNVKPHLDISIHNVPFGKSMTPKNIEKSYNKFLEENPGKSFPEFKHYIPFNTKKIDAILASQVVLYKTKKMGLMIIKDGEETSGKSNDKYRKWFMENCIIKKIMKIPSGAFTCTGTKTVCIYFIKKEGQMTENIQYLQLSDDGNKIIEICHVSMADMKENHYSWDPNSYIIDEEMEKMMSKSKCEWKKLGDIVKYEKKSKRNAKYGNRTGKYPYFKSSNIVSSYVDVPDFTVESVIIGDGGKPNVNYGKEFSASDHCIVFNPKGNDFITKWIYYFLKNNLSILEKYYNGAGIENISKEKISNINIPVPSLETQTQVVQILDDLAEQKQLLSGRKSGIERQMKYYLETQIKSCNDINVSKLGSLCEYIKSGKGIKKEDRNGTLYPYIGGGINAYTGTYVDKFIFDGSHIVCAQDGSIGAVNRILGKFYCNEHAHVLKIGDDDLSYYTQYYLKYIVNYEHITTGMIPKLTKSNLVNIDILITNNFKENREYLDKLETKKNSIDEEISDIDTLMKQVLEQSYN